MLLSCGEGVGGGVGVFKSKGGAKPLSGFFFCVMLIWLTFNVIEVVTWIIGIFGLRYPDMVGEFVHFGNVLSEGKRFIWKYNTIVAIFVASFVIMAKTKPTSIRFDPEKLALVKVKKGLQTPQQVVNYLLDTFWWQNELVAGAKETQAALPYIKPEEPKLPPFDAYKGKIKELKNIPDCQALVRAAKSDPDLADWQKRQIETMSIEKSKTFEF